ncbi:hypothetical protein [Glacieibacterium frigidum]|uniref:Uncharacterized protein n=1 Tax=Glacieibacterium frigidum TaxID=2593303 RepID=A0A552U8B5_9SPHN|nr:hypothetical protein [Glacieibacterium frigidum]TRW14457.1 hypothetical protein FMM06_12170 [Glacieibacterium frigidum]
MADLTQRVVWTACPAGFSRDKRFLHINLHVSPRLDLPAGIAPTDISHFDAWHDWPATLASARFTVRGLGPDPLKAQIARPDGDFWPPRDVQGDFVPDSRVWQALFPTDTPVIPHAFDDLRDHDVLTYPLAALADSIEAAYVDLATDPTPGLPRPRELLNGHPLFASAKDDKPKPNLPQLLDILRRSDGVGQVSDPDLMLAFLEAYHRPLATQVMRKTEKRLNDDGTPDFSDPHEATTYRTVERVPLPDPDTLREVIDFHRIVAAIGQHPALMRLTGLVVPLRVPADGIAPGQKQVQVIVQWKNGAVPALDDGFCVTHATVQGNGFMARPRTNTVVDGWLRAGSDSFTLVQLDVDGAGLSIKNFATQLPRIREERFDDEGGHDRVDTTGTPRLRTAGIQFAQVRRDRAIRGLFASAGGLDDKLNAGGTVELFAEDLIKGWRIDIHDAEKQGKWQSLMRFDGRYGLRNTGDAVATRDEEGIARLSATGTADDDAPDPLKKILKASEALFGWTGWSLAAPLPGKVIMPDDTSHEVAPNTAPAGLPLETEFAAHPKSLPTLRFGHHYRARLRSADLAGWGPGQSGDEVAAPGVATDKLFFGRYEPVETPVLTVPDGDAAPADGESMPRAALRTMDDAARNTMSTRRNLHPARVAARFAETHGVLDDGDGRPRAELWQTLADRDNDFESDVAITDAWNPDENAPPAKVRTVFSHAPSRQPTPYPADPLTGGVAIRVTGVPSIDPEKLHFIPFYAKEWDPVAKLDWLKDESFEVVATDGGQFGWDPDRRTFHVPLPRAERARLYISAVVPDEGIELFKLREQIIVREGLDAWRKIEPRVKAGQHWMFTPSRMVELVHAVQRPLIVPQLIKPFVDRDPGAIRSRLTFRTPLHAKSTVRLDIDGDWIEIDDTTPDKPHVRRLSAHAFDRKLARLETPANSLEVVGNHVFADTRARYVTYRAVATTRFREFMPLDIRQDPDLVSVTSAPKGIWVPSSNRPPAPGIRYVVPTFGWTRTQDSTGRRSWRRGGGLRVYLDRPWFSSGSNEMLAVCLPREGAADPGNTPARNHVTQWGADPGWVSDRIETIAPAAVHFPLRVRSGNQLAYDLPAEDHPDAADPASDGKVLPGFAAGPYSPPGSPVQVDIVPHAVGYDDDRNLWYADIVVSPGETYFPFIRLALARFQPASIPGHHLSPAVLADFAQLTPDRLALVTRGERGDMRIVEVYGHLPEQAVSARAGDVRVTLQRLPAGADPDLGWKTADQAPPPPTGGQGQPGGIGGAGARVAIPKAKIAIPRALETQRFEQVERIARLDAPSQARLIEAERLIDLGEFQRVLIEPGLLEIIRPPLIHRETFHLPQRGTGERLRLLITESESYETEPAVNGRAGRRQGRVVYAEAVEL